MHDSALVFLVDESNSVRAIKGKYENNQPAKVFKTFDDSIEVDDYVVVETDSRWNMTVVKVTEVDVDVNFKAGEDIKWVVQSVERDKFDRILEEEQRMITEVHAAQLKKEKAELQRTMMGDYGQSITPMSLEKPKD